MTIGLVYAAFIFFGALFSGAMIFFGNRSIRFLREIPPSPVKTPKVSVVVAARNEEATIEKGVRSLMAQDYPDYEVCVVNDRSEDGTGAVLARLQREFPALKVVEVRELPRCWLGKNYALWIGAGRAAGEFLLFTDADVVMKPATVSRAIRFVEENGLDHFTVIPAVTMKGILLRTFMSYFTFSFSLYYQTWKARDPKGKRYIGIGAFNLVRKSMYEEAGGHQKISLRPDDDLKLGKLLKLHGARVDLAYGLGEIEVEWYRSLGELFRGLEKNAFAGLNYSFFQLTVSTFLILLLNVGPFIAPFVLAGAAQALSLVSLAVILFILLDNGRFHGLGVLPSVLFPVSALMFIAVMWNSALKAVSRGGIVWRGTVYPLAELRRSRI